MSKEVSLIVLGVWLIILPRLGFPGDVRMTLAALTGGVIVIMGFLLRRDVLSRGIESGQHNSFVENSAPHHETPTHEHKERITSLN